MTDAELAALLAGRAAQLLLDLRSAAREEGAALGVAGDQAANALIVGELARHRPGDAVLSEETPDTLARLQRDRVWVVDPLDGTREYSAGRDDFAVHVALAVDREPAVGAVALPARGLVLRSDMPPPLAAVRRPPRLVVSRSRAPALSNALAAALGAELLTLGSAGAKAMAVLLGEAEIYYHCGGQQEWDNCAPAAVALAAGLHASRADGSPLRYNGVDTSVPDLLVAVPGLAPAALRALAELGG